MIFTDLTSPRYLYPAFFRVALGIILLIDLVFMFPIAADNFSIEGYEYAHQNVFFSFLRENIYFFLAFFALVILLFITGIGKRYTSFLVFVCFTIYYLLLAPNVTWGDTILQHSLLFFVGVNSFAYASFQPEKQTKHMLHKVAVWSLMLHVCFIFMSNGYHKIQNVDWQNGVAVAYFLKYSEPLDIFHIGGVLSKNYGLTKLATYGVLLFQLLFPLAMIFSKPRKIWIWVGIVLHCTMGFFLHLYKFQLILLLHFGFFFTDKELLKTAFFRFFRNFAVLKK